MTQVEYERIQQDLSSLADDVKLWRKGFNAEERGAYKKAVLACKSALSQYNPSAERRL